MKKIMIFLFILLLAYFYMLFNANKLETLMTFPAVGDYESSDFRGYDGTKINFEEINIKDKNGNNINGLYMTGTSQKTIYYFHGNGAALDYFYKDLKYMNDLGYSVFAYDYPGYGKSTGFPYKDNVENFSQDFFDYIKKEKNLKNEDLIIWGYSIGSAVATDFASKNDFEKIILIAPFTSRYDMATKLFSFPIQKILFLPNSFITGELVKNLKKPALIVHGNSDGVVPFLQGKKVFENYSGNEKYFVEIDKGNHNFLLKDYGNSLKILFKKFLSGEKLDFKELLLDENEMKKLENEAFLMNKNNYQSGSNNEELPSYNSGVLIEEKPSIVVKNETINTKTGETIPKTGNFDFISDDSITKYVSSDIPFNTPSYIPKNLKNIIGEYLIDTKGNQKLRKEALENLEIMGEDFYKKFNTKLKIVSAYRSYEYQVGIKKGGCSDKFCAKAGFSEHQTGLAFDLFEATSESEFLSKNNLKSYFEWLNQNAYKYGFTNSYKNGIEIDTYVNEPWHWRYVGYDFAKYLQENDLSFGKYMKNK